MVIVIYAQSLIASNSLQPHGVQPTRLFFLSMELSIVILFTKTIVENIDE